MASPELTDRQAALLAEAVANDGTLHALIRADRRVFDQLVRMDLMHRAPSSDYSAIRYEVTGRGWAVHAVRSGLAAALADGEEGESRG